MMKRLTLFFVVAVLGTCSIHAQSGEPQFSFKYFLRLMNFGAKGQSLDAYKKYASGQGLSLIHHAEESSEIYMVWADQLTYKTGHMSETYTKTGNRPRCINVDLTVNGKDKYTPITVTLVFPDKEAQQRFRKEGMNLGCIVNDKIEDSDIDVTWKNVSGIKYIIDAKRLTSWRFIYFYEKDGMYMSTFLF